MADLLQVLTLMAVPAVLFALMGYLNRRANRRPIMGAPRSEIANSPAQLTESSVR